MAFQPFVIPLFAVDDASAVLHPDAFRYRSAEAPAFQGALGAAEQVSHFLFCDLVDVTGTFGFHGMVSTPPVAAGWLFVFVFVGAACYFNGESSPLMLIGLAHFAP